MTGYATNDGTVGLSDGRHWSMTPRDWEEVWEVFSGPRAYCGSLGGVGGSKAFERVVKLLHLRIKSLSSGILILLRGSCSKMRLRMKSSSGDKGSIELKNLGFFR